MKFLDSLEYIYCSGQNSGLATILSVLNVLFKVETLNSAASQKVASFYRKLQTSGGGSLAKLHMTSLKGKIFGWFSSLNSKIVLQLLERIQTMLVCLENWEKNKSLRLLMLRLKRRMMKIRFSVLFN